MIRVRNASLSDAERLVEIYGYYIQNTAITFDYDAPSIESFKKRMRHIMERYPFLVLLSDDRIMGFTYANTFKDRSAYDWSCEVTIYIDHTQLKRGFGRLLYSALEEKLIKMGMLNLYACIAYPDGKDPYLTTNSADFHAHLGYTLIGKFNKCGFKFDRWYDMIWMEKFIGEHLDRPSPIHKCLSSPE